jgi:hypothetical protein
MKLNDIVEMARPAGTHPEFTDDQVNDASQWLADADVITTIENDRFDIIRKENTIALRRRDTNAIVGWVLLGKVTKVYGREMYPLVNIQILPKYRHTSAIMVLVNAVRELTEYPIYVDNAVFTGGQQLLLSLQKHGLANVLTMNKQTGDLTPYKVGDLTHDDSHAIVLERTRLGLHGSYLPGHPDVLTQIPFFENMCNEILAIPS